jgi:hypothetical protein
MGSLYSFTAVESVEGTNAVKADGNAGAKSDTINLQRAALGLHAKADGSVKIVDQAGNVSVLRAVAGQDYSRLIVRVYSTDTTLANDEFNLLYGV